MKLIEYFTESGLSVKGVPAWAAEVVMSKTPFAHQIEDLKYMGHLQRSGLYSEPGTGKTLPMQAYGIYKACQGSKGIYIMPPILITQFMNSLKLNYSGIENHLSIVAYHGSPSDREKMLKEWVEKDFPDILVMSNVMFVKAPAEFKEAGAGKVRNRYRWLVVDEATSIKTPSSHLHKTVLDFVRGEKEAWNNQIVLATGTPVETNVEDCYGLIRILVPNAYTSIKNFEYNHIIKFGIFIPSKARVVHQTQGYKNLDLLHDNLYARARRVLKSDVSDLPPRLISEYVINLSKQHARLYKKLVDERMVEIGEEMIDMVTAQALYQATQQVLLNPEKYGEVIKENTLFEALDEIINELEGRKVLIYAWYNASVDTICERYAHLNPVKINGTVTGDKREQAKQSFINDKECKLLVSNPKSGGVGIDGLQDVCSHVIYAEVCPFIGTFQQSVDRLHRKGQKAESVNVYVLVANNTVAVKLRNDLVKKDSYQESVMKDKRAILADLQGADGIQGSLDDVD